jgi:hypothetical protein
MAAEVSLKDNQTMKSKLVLCLALVLSGLFSALSARAEMDIFQISPTNVSDSPVSVQVTKVDFGERFTVFYKTNETSSDKFLHGQLQVSDGDNKISSVAVEKIWTTNGVRFEFTVSAAFLTASKFTVTEQGHIREMGMPGFANWWFYLSDFVTNAVLPHPATVATDENNHPLKVLLSKSDLVVLGTITNEPIEIQLESGVPNYICRFQVEDVLKGNTTLKGRVIAVNIMRFEMEAKDKHPLIKKGSECILFLKADKPQTPSWVTADFWFGVQYPSPWMARDLKQLAAEIGMPGMPYWNARDSYPKWDEWDKKIAELQKQLDALENALDFIRTNQLNTAEYQMTAPEAIQRIPSESASAWRVSWRHKVPAGAAAIAGGQLVIVIHDSGKIERVFSE